MDRRLIVVLGLPSGGTSLVAGMLSHLGVDMGRVLTPAERVQIPNARPYEGFECGDLIGACAEAATLNEWFSAFRRYCERRLASADGPVGVKFNQVAHLGLHERVAELPIRVVQVRRDLAETFASDQRYTGDPGRGALLGSLYVGLMRFIERVPPVVTLNYRSIRNAPDWAVTRLASAFSLNPKRDAWESAVEFVWPEGVRAAA